MKKLIRYLKAQIKELAGFSDPRDEKSWSNQIGVLISIDEAQLIVDLLTNKHSFYKVVTHKNGTRYFSENDSKEAHQFLQKNSEEGALLTFETIDIKALYLDNVKLIPENKEVK